MSERKTIIKTVGLKKYYTVGGNTVRALDGVDVSVLQGEFVCIAGRSGSGKSTLLRIIAGLIKPTSGRAHYRECPITRPVQGISMVFQNFALLPWLTVLENVELGLEAHGMPQKERRQKALAAIDMIRSVRMSKAASLIMENRYSIQEIAEMVGYSDTRTLRKHFTEQFGVSPSKYMEKE